MNRRILLGMILPVGALASVLALLTGERQTVSLQIWLACFVVGFAVATVVQLRDRAPFAVSQRLSIWNERDDSVPPMAMADRRLRTLESLVLRSRDNPRTFSQQLQPQLIALATHHLRITHGVDIERNTSRSVAALGELSWLIDETITSRTPTLDELDRFMHALINPNRVRDHAVPSPTSGDSL